MKQLVLLLSICVLFSCDNTTSAFTNEGDIATSPVFEMADDLEEMVVEKKFNAAPSKQVEQKIIKTGNLRFETQELEKTRTRIVAAVKKAGGYIQSDNSGKNYDSHYQNLTIRVPSQQFDTVFTEIGEGVAYFDEKTVSQRDVTEEFVDIQARLKAKRALEERYLALLVKAKNVQEMLSIERELANIREEIESREGRLKYLQSQVSESTIHISFYKTTVETGVTTSYGTKILNALKGGWNGVSVFFLGLLHLWPFLILVGAGVFFIRRYVRKKKK